MWVIFKTKELRLPPELFRDDMDITEWAAGCYNPSILREHKDKAELLPSPQQFLYLEVLRDHFECTHSQLFWGLPSLHSEALVATAFVPQSSSQL